MNTNNAPERIELPNGYYGAPINENATEDEWAIFNNKGETQLWASQGNWLVSKYFVEKLSEAMTKQAPCTEVDDAVKFAKRIYAECATYDQAVPYLQAYGDACRLDGARDAVRMREALKTADELAGRFMTSMGLAGVVPEQYSNDPLAEMYFMAAKFRSQYAALSPETVCGGE